MEKDRETIFFGEMPTVCGYGITVLARSEKEAINLLKKSYFEWRKAGALDMTFNRAMEYFGGGVRQIEIGKTYYDDFKE